MFLKYLFITIFLCTREYSPAKLIKLLPQQIDYRRVLFRKISANYFVFCEYHGFWLHIID